MNHLIIAKQIFAYSKYLSKLSNKVQQKILDEIFNGKKYEQLDEKQKDNLNLRIKYQLNDIEDHIDEITDNINEKTFIANCYLNGSYIPDEDDQKFEQVLSLYNTFKKHKQITKKDIKQYKTYGELFKEVSFFISKQNVYQFANDYCQFIDRVGSFSCYKVDDFQQARVLFNGTGWCVKSRGYFERYGAPYYLIFNGQQRFALIHIDSQQCKDINDNAIEASYLTKDFVILLMKIFNKANNSEYVIEGDFEGYEYYYVLYASKYIEKLPNLFYDVLQNSNYEDIYAVCCALRSSNKLQQSIQGFANTTTLEEILNKASNNGLYEDIYDLIKLLLEENIELMYPNNFAWYIVEKDDVDSWKKYWKLNQTEDMPMDYDQMVLSSYDILNYEIKNNFKIIPWMFNDVNFEYNLKSILQEKLNDVVDIQTAKSFFNLFELSDEQQQDKLFKYILTELNISQQQYEIFQQLYNKVKKKRAFDKHPNLPGF